MRVLPSFEGHDLAFVTTNRSFSDPVRKFRFYLVEDSNISCKLRLILTFLGMALVVLKERPHIVFTTGAAPGFFAIVLGRLLGAKTIWLDSLANLNRLSLCGSFVRRFADLWLTQWPHLSCEGGPEFKGSVL